MPAMTTTMIALGTSAILGGVAPVPCDCNSDGSVDVIDLSIFVNNYGGADPSCDLSGDGVITRDDLPLWISCSGDANGNVVLPASGKFAVWALGVGNGPLNDTSTAQLFADAGGEFYYFNAFGEQQTSRPQSVLIMFDSDAQYTSYFAIGNGPSTITEDYFELAPQPLVSDFGTSSISSVSMLAPMILEASTAAVSVPSGPDGSEQVFVGRMTVTDGAKLSGELEAWIYDPAIAATEEVVLPFSGAPVTMTSGLRLRLLGSATPQGVTIDGAPYNVHDLYITDAAGSVSCTGNLNGDLFVDSSDLAILLAAWGQPGPSDFNLDDQTDSSDLAVLLAAWGLCD